MSQEALSTGASLASRRAADTPFANQIHGEAAEPMATLVMLARDGGEPGLAVGLRRGEKRWAAPLSRLAGFARWLAAR